MIGGPLGANLVNEALQAVVPLRELLKTHGIEASRQALLEECDADFSLAAMAKCIERRGLRVRIISVGKSDLPHIGTALIELRDQTPALLRSERGRHCRLELADGAIVTSAPDVERMIGGQAIEVHTAWSQTGTFLPRIMRMCLEEPRVRSSLILFFVTLLLSGVMGFAQPALARHIIDSAIPEGASRLLLVLAAALVLVAAMSSLIGNVSERASIYVEKRLAAAAYPGLVQHYLSLPFAQLQRQTVGAVFQTLGSIPTVIHGAVHNVIGGIIDLLLAIGYVVLIADLAPQLALVLVVGHFALAALIIPWAQEAARRQQELMTTSGEQSDRLLELVDRILTLRIEVASEWALGRWMRALRSVQDQGLRLELANSLVAEMVVAVKQLLMGGTVLWAAHAALTGQRTLGEFFALVAGATAASGALSRLISFCGTLLAMRVQLRRIDELLVKATAPEIAGASRGPRPEDGIIVDGAWFRYGEHTPWVIQNVSLSFAGGSVNTIRWPSGRGKTTLLRLIAGLNAPAKGTITVHGLDAAAARQLIAYVPQNCPLFAGSILYNLRIISGGATRDRIEEAAAITGLKTFAEQWPMGLETIIATGGGNVSSGQRQLIIFTAVVASRKPVLLLDEATTHLDLIMRAGLQDAPLLAGRTIVNVMHFDDPEPEGYS